MRATQWVKRLLSSDKVEQEMLNLARSGNIDGQLKIARYYADPKIASHNNAEALYWYNTAAKMGSEVAQLELGLFYIRLPETKKNESESLRWLLTAGQARKVEIRIRAQYLYREVTDFIKAREYAKDKTMYPIGIAQIAKFYLKGNILEQDVNEALRLYRKASEAGNDDANFDLGELFEEGKMGVKKNIPEAIKWYQKGLEKKPKGYYFRRIAYLYLKGLGIEKNLEKAIDSYKMAIKHGDRPSEDELISLYKQGESLDENTVKLARQLIKNHALPTCDDNFHMSWHTTEFWAANR